MELTKEELRTIYTALVHRCVQLYNTIETDEEKRCLHLVGGIFELLNNSHDGADEPVVTIKLL